MNRYPGTFPSVGQAALLLVASWLLQYVVTLGLYDMRELLGLSNEQIMALAMLLSYGVLVATLGHLMRVSFWHFLHPGTSSARSTFLLLVPPTLLLLPLVILLDIALMEFLELMFPVSAWEKSAFALMRSATLPMAVAVCVLAPLFEEVLFRGILLRAFLQRYPRWLAIGYSALMFGAAHLNVYQFSLAFLLGLLLGWLYERSRSLIPGIALHAGINTSVTLLTHGDHTHAPSSASMWDVPLLVWLVALAMATAGTWALRFVLCNSVQTRPMQDTEGFR